MTENAIHTYKRIDLDGEGTLEGLLKLVGRIPDEVPLSAAVATAYSYEGCPPEAIEDESIEHEHGPRVGFILEWEVES